MIKILYSVPKGTEGALQNGLFYPYRVPKGTVFTNHIGTNFPCGISQIPGYPVLGKEVLADFAEK